jgi:hypothetical protein
VCQTKASAREIGGGRGGGLIRSSAAAIRASAAVMLMRRRARSSSSTQEALGAQLRLALLLDPAHQQDRDLVEPVDRRRTG